MYYAFGVNGTGGHTTCSAGADKSHNLQNGKIRHTTCNARAPEVTNRSGRWFFTENRSQTGLVAGFSPKCETHVTDFGEKTATRPVCDLGCTRVASCVTGFSVLQVV